MHNRQPRVVHDGPAVELAARDDEEPLGTEVRESMTTFSLSLGDWPLFRFDARGRVSSGAW